MKKTIFMTFTLCISSILLMAQGGTWNNNTTGSKWDISYNKEVKTTSFEVKDSVMVEIFKKGTFKQYILTEKEINPNTYAVRTLIVFYRNTGEVVLNKTLENGKLNKVIIDLKALRKLYPDNKTLSEQVFYICEKADDLSECQPKAFRFE